MLRSLDAAERRALLAHERSHLLHRHHLFLTALRLAAAVNPLLYPVFRAMVFTIERWADEDAATAVQDRALVARTLGKAALASLRHPAAALALAAHHVPRRMQALLAAPPPRRTVVILALGAALLLITALSLLEAAHDTERLRSRNALLPGNAHAVIPGRRTGHCLRASSAFAVERGPPVTCLRAAGKTQL